LWEEATLHATQFGWHQESLVIEHVYWSYRRSRKEMPADKEELANAIAEATALTVGCDDWASFSSQDLSFLRNSSFEENNQESILLELTLPEALEPGMVRLRRMKPGEKDESGRPSPVPTDETFLLPCDLIITRWEKLLIPHSFQILESKYRKMVFQ